MEMILKLTRRFEVGCKAYKRRILEVWEKPGTSRKCWWMDVCAISEPLLQRLKNLPFGCSHVVINSAPVRE